MSSRRFELILRFIHLNDSETQPSRGHPEFDKLYKFLDNTLVKAALPGHPSPPGETTPINIKAIKSRTHKYTNPHCKVCPNALGKRISCIPQCREHRIPSQSPCMDTSLIYCILCAKCDKMYIGLTSQSIRQRFNSHRYASTRKLQIPLYRHFSHRSHDFKRDHRIVPLEHSEPATLADWEQYWIRTLNTKLPHGLNSLFGKSYYPQTLTPSLPSESSLNSVVLNPLPSSPCPSTAPPHPLTPTPPSTASSDLFSP